MNSVSKKVKNKILNASSKDKLWSYADFQNMPQTAVAKAFSNLYKEGIIARAEKGLYYVPRKTILGVVPPRDNIIAFAKVSKKANFSCISGLSGYNKIGLTTQVPKTTTIACDHPMRSTTNIKYIQRNKPHSGTEVERIVLDAIIDADHIPDTTPAEVLNKIKNMIKAGKVNINDLGKSALNETPRVKAVVGALGQELGMDLKILSKLKTKINANTVIYSDIIKALKFANEWRIKPRTIHR